MKFISIVVPVYNEADNLRHFSSAVRQVMAALPYQYQLLFINDGSTDTSLNILQQLQHEDEHIHYISLSRNFGHQAALTCGLDQADGDAIITMDGDMQHPPALLPRLLSEWEQGAEIVQTIRLDTEGVVDRRQQFARVDGVFERGAGGLPPRAETRQRVSEPFPRHGRSGDGGRVHDPSGDHGRAAAHAAGAQSRPGRLHVRETSSRVFVRIINVRIIIIVGVVL